MITLHRWIWRIKSAKNRSLCCRVSGRNRSRKWASAPFCNGQRHWSTIRYPAFGFSWSIIIHLLFCFLVFIPVRQRRDSKLELGNLPAINKELLNENKPIYLLWQRMQYICKKIYQEYKGIYFKVYEYWDFFNPNIALFLLSYLSVHLCFRWAFQYLCFNEWWMGIAQHPFIHLLMRHLLLQRRWLYMVIVVSLMSTVLSYFRGGHQVEVHYRTFFRQERLSTSMY